MTGEKESEVRKMWVSRRKWDCLLYRIKKCEDDIKIQKVNTENLIRNTAKKILEQPEELREEIQGVERIEKYIDEFIGLDKESEVRKMKILPLCIENGRLILGGVRLTGVEGYTIKISSELPKGNAELNLKIIVSFPENTQEQNPLRD